MVKRTHKNTPAEINDLNEKETLAISKHISEPPANSRSQKGENSKTDDLIGLLSDAYENKRARQVFEWETVRRKSFQKAA